ncbi:MAG TPA: hypothetical protein VNV41_02680 [Candidatus Acidoferrales bacterium]|jgi:excisionase family DNA binding protein|nr:hypothetical protein [Candidatus Acidoferrales bacterium]
MSTQSVVQSDPQLSRWLSIHEASIYICATHWFVEELCRRKKIPHILNGKRFVIDRRDLDRYMEAHKVAPEAVWSEREQAA